MSRTIIKPTLPKIDYTSRDFESMKSSLVEFLKQRFPDVFTDYTESQLGIILLEIVSYAFDNLSYNLDRQINELFIATATERKSMVNLTRLLAYKLAPASASSVDLVIDTAPLASLPGTIVIAKGAKTQSGNVIFETEEVITIEQLPANSGNWTVNGNDLGATPVFSVVQGETLVETFTANGAKFQEHTVSRDGLIEGSVSTTVGGADWVLVSSLQLGDPSDSTNQDIYEVLLDDNDRATLKFGDGVTGNIPSNAIAIVTIYRVGGGDVGNVAANTIEKGLAALNGSTAVTVGIKSHVAATGGADRESIEHARIFAPEFAKTSDRAITFGDYFNLSNGFSDGTSGTIGKAGVLADASDGVANHVTVYTWAVQTSGKLGSSSTVLNGALKSFLDSRRSLAVQLDVLPGIDVEIEVAALIRVSPEIREQDIEPLVQTAVSDLFEEERVRFGNELKVSWIYDAIQAVSGVIWVHVTKPDPSIIADKSVEEIETGSLPSQTTVPTPDLQVKLPGTSSAVDDFYCNYRVLVQTVNPQARRRIIAYNGTTKIATVDIKWDTNPSLNDVYVISHPRRVKLDSNASAADYTDQVLIINKGAIGGSGIDQARAIIEWDDATNVAVVDEDWVPGETPTATAKYTLTPDFRVAQNKRVALKGGVSVITILNN